MKISQIISLIIEVGICTIIAFFGILTAAFGDKKFYGILMIIMSGALLWLLIKNPKVPKEEADTNNYKLQGAGRIILIITCVITSVVFFVCGITSDSDSNDNKVIADIASVSNANDNMATADKESITMTSDELGNYAIAIKEYYTSKGFYDENLLVVVYSFTNNSNNAISFSDAIEDKIYQNGVELDLYIAANIPNQVDIRDSNKELKPGASYDVSRAYVLNFATPSEFDIELYADHDSSTNIKYAITMQ